MSDSDPAAQLKQAHILASLHRKQIEKSAVCGCFFCETRFDSARIEEWTDEGDTALCPNCGVDSVIGDASRLAVTDPDFLRRMRIFWFER